MGQPFSDTGFVAAGKKRGFCGDAQSGCAALHRKPDKLLADQVTGRQSSTTVPW
jgi:hypothetical protein